MNRILHYCCSWQSWSYRPPSCIISLIHLSIHPFIIHSFFYSSTHSFTHSSIHSFIHPLINSFIHPSISNHSFIHPFIHSSPSKHEHDPPLLLFMAVMELQAAFMYYFINSSIHPSIHYSFILLFIHPLIQSSIHPFIHHCIHPSIHPLINSFIHPYPTTLSFIHSCIPHRQSVNKSLHYCCSWQSWSYRPPSCIISLIHLSIHPFIIHSFFYSSIH